MVIKIRAEQTRYDFLDIPPGKYALAVIHDENMNGKLDTKGIDRLLDGYRAIMKQIYSPHNFYRRVRNFLTELRAPDITIPLNFQRFLAFFRSSLRLGILGKERLQYWHLLLWTLIRKPRLISVAITLSIYGYHYRRICERYIY